MKSLPDHHRAHRIASLRAMQGLPFRIPPGHTVYRQSDFETSKLFRYVVILGFVVVIATLFEPDPALSTARPLPAAGHPASPALRATV